MALWNDSQLVIIQSQMQTLRIDSDHHDSIMKTEVSVLEFRNLIFNFD